MSFPNPRRTEDNPTFRDPHEAFRNAITAGRLSDQQNAPNYAGNYMYMGTWDGQDAFKHCETREYLPEVQP